MSILYFYAPSACSLSGQIVLEWLAQPYELCRADAKIRQTPAYRRVNPLGKVPAMLVDGHPLAENSAILTHLAERKPGLLPPHGTWQRDCANMWLSYIGTTLHPAFGPIFNAGRYLPYPSTHAALAEQARARVKAELAYVNRCLGQGSGWLVGQRPTAADAYMYAISRWGKKHVDIPRTMPHLHRHQLLMERDPAVVFALAIERGETAKSPGGAFLGHVNLEKRAVSAA